MLKLIDAHFHLWDPARQELPWLAGVPSLNRAYVIEQLESEYDALGVEFLGGVYVEVDAPDELLEDRLVGANPSPKILGKVLHSMPGPYMRVPLQAVGIRYPLHTPSAASGTVLMPDFQAGLALLEKAGLTFDLVNRGDDIEEMSEAFSRYPKLRLIIDHLGNIRTLDRKTRAAIEKLAQLPHVYVKVSGDDPVSSEVVKFVLDTFGRERMLWASNWPVVTLNSSLREHFELAYSIFGDDPDFFENNARAAYGLDQQKGRE
ncbi:L-fuconolactonase [Arcanobacterium wilhelmae]|uniref:L-fuconolactonase n=1 Tax=Arcanobacterium wilhelmae TaxID=1803177 RepID=A0ABT9NC88_9ACTO|nr:amidohydrolase family protein [Arcanobacterium wilhelmae]MDP9801001.1 L-fuconolactonase [Arcanobacterium wilhelmae]WFN90361.1 amidohydrolase family protein [Arcanobacterium wilhelmae]